MSAHAFRFEPLLNWTEQREEQQMLVLASAQREEQVARDSLEILLAERDHELGRLAEQPALIDPGARQAAIAYIEHLDERIGYQRGVIQEAVERVASERAVLVELEQEKQSLMRLRERDEAEAMEAERRQEANAVDDLNMTRHIRASRAAEDELDGGEGVA